MEKFKVHDLVKVGSHFGKVVAQVPSPEGMCYVVRFNQSLVDGGPNPWEDIYCEDALKPSLWERSDWGWNYSRTWRYGGSLSISIVEENGKFALCGEKIPGILIPHNLKASSFEDAAEEAENLLRETFRSFLSELEES